MTHFDPTLVGYVLAGMQIRVDELESALERIAAGVRNDGSWNLSREACQQIALEALGRG